MSFFLKKEEGLDFLLHIILKPIPNRGHSRFTRNAEFFYSPALPINRDKSILILYDILIALQTITQQTTNGCRSHFNLLYCPIKEFVIRPYILIGIKISGIYRWEFIHFHFKDRIMLHGFPQIRLFRNIQLTGTTIRIHDLIVPGSSHRIGKTIARSAFCMTRLQITETVQQIS